MTQLGYNHFRFVRPLVLAVVLALVLAVSIAAAAKADSVLELKNAEGQTVSRLSLDDLKRLGTREIQTATPWTNGISTFQGVPLALVLEGWRADEAHVLARALNDYAVEMPIDEVLAYSPLLAWSLDGVQMSVRQRGPLWLMFDFDRYPEIQNDLFMSRSVWQLNFLALVR